MFATTRKTRRMRWANSTVRFVLAASLAAAALAQNGESLFNTNCAGCHQNGNAVGAPLPLTLRQMSWQTILGALESGKMKAIGNRISAGDRESIARFLGTAVSGPTLTAPSCSAAQARSTAAIWNGWADPANTRFQSAKAAGLTKASTPKLKLKWAFGFPGVTTAFGTPAVVDGRVYVGAADGSVYALEAATGCTYWIYSAAAGVRVSPIVSDNRRSVYFGDLKGNVYAVSAANGVLQWKVRAADHPLSVITGSPKLEGNRLYVPVSGRDESIAAINPDYECCTFRGSVAALDANTGAQVWQAYTVFDEPKPTGQNAKGTKTWGPSGAVPWSSPTLDLQKRVLYIGTGVNYSNPPTETSDAVLAFRMDTGRLVWARQFTPADSYNFACGAEDKTNCPKYPFADADFGNSGILRPLPGGKRILVISDKAGTVFGLDPDQQGKILWKQKIASGGVNGGTMWGGASDDQGVAYIGISDFAAGKPEIGGGLVALQLTTGEQLWKTPAPKPTCLSVPGCSAAQPAPVTAIPGVAFLGSWDGHIRAYETRKGAIIWDFDTARDFDTVNRIKARGGSINSMAPVVSGGMLYITSGYSGAAMPGNVLLAFSVDGK
jgi:polyvinyl alcohol dehydrogenase (cytochrome)